MSNGGDPQVPPTKHFDGEPYYNMTDAAKYAGYSPAGFRNLMRRLEKTKDEIPVWKFPGSRERYIKKADLDNYFKPQRVKLSDDESDSKDK